MGNFVCCGAPKPSQTKKPKTPKRYFSTSSPHSGISSQWNKIRSSKKENVNVDDEAIIKEQAIAAALLFRHHQQNGTLPAGMMGFDRSSSVSLLLVLNLNFALQDLKVNDLETKHFVLVHGGGFGAWCWYKTIALLVEAGFKVDALDLTGSGINSFDTNQITNLSQYVKPLTDLLEKLGDGEKVILVGHDFGGACLSYAMELFPHKIAKSIFVAAVMLTSGQSTLDVLTQQATSDDLIRKAQTFLYSNGNECSPTAIGLNKSLLGGLLFNQSPSKDVALASVSMRPIPFAPVLEKLSLSDKNYGTVRRFYIETTEDNAIPISLQESMINSSPPELVFRIKGSDHSPFFSRPQALHKQLVEMAKICKISSS
ncbi:hypothetical protein GIB67_009559 [Kingdonia uniflora]|uniref:AB hydrolase-1 domain-containing protein n=1 Tax=Kingdonia uniflora TaxID=39325 RepID=A0A7J7NWZ3_9MAGN|nr:hypothetical protein GIB67_009559 [Kingdonia uniflora]